MKPSVARVNSHYQAAASFAKLDNRLDQLVALGLSELAAPLPLRDECLGAEHLEKMALFARAAEEQFSQGLLPIFATGSQSDKQHPLDWLNFTERKRNDENRSCHEWYLCLDDGALTLTFEHGQFGYRKERQASWSQAFARLADIFAGCCTWHRFGDPESRRTLLGKGQFYWQNPATAELIPVDNFVFELDTGRDFTIAGVSHRSVLSTSHGEAYDGAEWYDDYAQALLRLADILEGSVSFDQVGTLDKDAEEDYVAASCQRRPQIEWLPALAAQGKFVVKCIFQADDQHSASTLVYRTREGRQAVLTSGPAGWAVRLNNARGEWQERQFEVAQAPDALRTLSKVLEGSLEWKHLAGSAAILAKEALAREAQAIILSRAASCNDPANMVRVSADMSREEIMAKVLGIPIEDVPAYIAKHATPPAP